ncbi:MAG: metallophosphoesterase [Nitrospirota bacterium]|nr:metallophosphoesterase [Nitrospirota bacterium]
MTTLIHVTDTHLFAAPDGCLKGVNTLDTLRRVVADAVARHPEAVWVLTGDLSQDETVKSYRLLSEALGAVPGRIFALPGNHDDPDAMRAGFARDRHIRMDGSFFAGGWQVVLVNSRIAGKVAGRVSKGELARLSGALAAHPRHAALICVHHQPLPVGSPWIDEIGMENGDELLDVAGAAPNARALLWGHVHQEYDGSRNGLRTISSPSTCIQFAPNSPAFQLDRTAPGYRVVQLNAENGLETRVVRVGAAPEFIYEPGDPGYETG